MQKIGSIPDSMADEKGEFTEGDLSHGQAPTLLRAAWLNTVQRELVALVEGFGETLKSDQDNQLYRTLRQQMPLCFESALPNIRSSSGPSIYPEILSSDHRFFLQISEGKIIIPENQRFLWRGVWQVHTEDYALAHRSFTTTAYKSYHLRWRPYEGFCLCDLQQAQYNPSALAETDMTFDTQVDDMLIALVQTPANNIPLVTMLANAVRFHTYWQSTQHCQAGIKAEAPFWVYPPVATLTLNWARTPTPAWLGLWGWNLGNCYRCYQASNETAWGVYANRYGAQMVDVMEGPIREITGFYYQLDA